jgi:hypothetical protein
MRRPAFTCLVLLGACDAASPDPGIAAALTVAGAQYLPDGMPTPTGGPAVLDLTTPRPTVAIGLAGQRLRGVLAPDARAAIIALHDGRDAWLVTAGPPDLDTPGDASLAAAFALADATPAGPFTLDVAATDGAGRVGPAASIDLVADDVPPPTGTLVIALAWEGATDLDLHVADPLGGEAWSQHPNTWQPPPPGTPVDPTAYLTGGILDHDGNAACHRDGRPREAIRWQQPPPPGTYTIRVDTRAPCGDPAAAWYVAAYRDGALLAAARGVATPADALGDHGAGAGVLALTLSVP